MRTTTSFDYTVPVLNKHKQVAPRELACVRYFHGLSETAQITERRYFCRHRPSTHCPPLRHSQPPICAACPTNLIHLASVALIIFREEYVMFLLSPDQIFPSALCFWIPPIYVFFQKPRTSLCSTVTPAQRAHVAIWWNHGAVCHVTSALFHADLTLTDRFFCNI
jgi:hypothetical protein